MYHPTSPHLVPGYPSIPGYLLTGTPSESAPSSAVGFPERGRIDAAARQDSVLRGGTVGDDWPDFYPASAQSPDNHTRRPRAEGRRHPQVVSGLLVEPGRREKLTHARRLFRKACCPHLWLVLARVARGQYTVRVARVPISGSPGKGASR